MLTTSQLSELKRQMDQSEAMHHKIMAKMGDERFDLLAVWEQKERLDLAIGRLIRDAYATQHAVPRPADDAR